MKIIMDDSRLTNVIQLTEFLKGARKLVVSLEKAPIQEKYNFIIKTIRQFHYPLLRRKERRVIIKYLRKITGYKHSQLFDLIERARKGELVRIHYQRVNPIKIYTGSDVKLLEKTDEVHLRLSEGATQELLRREFELFKHGGYQTIARISHSHITNLRHSPVYKSSWINHTKARQIQIGITMPPENFGRPGSVRVDSVSQKDIYHINTIDEITQWEIVFCVPQITEDYMLPVLREILDQYPFAIFNFHSDRGGENINYQVASFLHNLLVKQTKSRSYHSNDNALVETKNGSVIRKNMGWEHIDQSAVDKINEYYQNWFNPYLNYHRPCGYPTITVDEKGKKKKAYKVYKVPYDALKAIPRASKYLKPGISFEKLDIIAYERSDNEFAGLMRNQERKLFDLIQEANQKDGLAALKTSQN